MQEALKNGKEPDDVLQSQIWRFAGQLLLDVPNCPVQLSQAVHSLMGTEPSAQGSVHSPVRQASEREAHTRQALDAISLTAQTMRQQQQSQTALQGSTSEAQNSNASTAGAFQPRQQQQVNVFQQMQSALAALNPSAAAGQTLESSTMYHMASAMATAMMTPFLQILEQQQERQQEERRVMLAKMESMNRRLQCIEGKLDSNASFYPLMALAMAQLSQQTHALAQYLTVGYSSSAAPLSPAASPKAAMLTPDKKRLSRQANARDMAKKQVANVQQRIDQQGQASMPLGAPSDGGRALTARAVLSRPPVNGMQIVYPGSAGEAYWCKWEGRYGITSKSSAWLQIVWLPQQISSQAPTFVLLRLAFCHNCPLLMVLCFHARRKDILLAMLCTVRCLIEEAALPCPAFLPVFICSHICPLGS